jgi:hypothetical protein
LNKPEIFHLELNPFDDGKNLKFEEKGVGEMKE